MLHLDYLKEGGNQDAHFIKRASGRYYTGEIVGRRLASEAATALFRARPNSQSIQVADPFGGDGRLVEWLIEAWIQAGFPNVRWNISLWDIDDVGFDSARARLKNIAARFGTKYRTQFKVLDTFAEALRRNGAFDIVITNPPWEILKPDRRELDALSPTSRKLYVSHMRAYDKWLGECFPLSQPRRKFAGWGTNLSRVGLEASLSIVKEGGIVGVVMPASLLADGQTAHLREHLLTEHSLQSATYYSAEAKLYDSADISSVAITLAVSGKPATSLTVATHDVVTAQIEESVIELDPVALRRVDYAIPISFGSKSLAILNGLSLRFPMWLDLESGKSDGLWAGREIDETGIAKWLRPQSSNDPLFTKGRMIGRYVTLEPPSQSVVKLGWTPPSSVLAHRIAWRDVSRPSQKRRMIATIIEPGHVAGNSLGVAYFKDLAEVPLLALLGVMNSTAFEFQLRAHLATGHVSLSALRKVAIPTASQLRQATELAEFVRDAIAAADNVASKVDAYVARNLYELTEEEYQIILDGFSTLTSEERLGYLKSYRDLSPPRSSTKQANTVRLTTTKTKKNYTVA